MQPFIQSNWDPLTRISAQISNDPCANICYISGEKGRKQLETDMNIKCPPCVLNDVSDDNSEKIQKKEVLSRISENSYPSIGPN